MRTSAADIYSELLALQRPVIETREAATRLQTSGENATQRLRSLEKAGLVHRLARGLWAFDANLDPKVAAPYLTAPYPAYVSFWSALAEHDMIEQIPRQIYVASLSRTKRAETPLGTFSIHRLPPELFDGFEGTPARGYLARPEKALFDTVYVRAPRGKRVYFPELSLPDGFDETRLEQWIERLTDPRIRTVVTRGLERALTQARP